VKPGHPNTERSTIRGDRYGAIAKGKAADILILDSNPLADIKATRKVRGVVLHGKWLDRGALDGLLAEAKAKAGKAN
jgi:imidazolonepropionase-like amidohydrolase